MKDISLIQNSEDYNAIIRVGENQNTKEFHVHSDNFSILRILFRLIFLKRDIYVTINKPKNSAIFEIILRIF